MGLRDLFKNDREDLLLGSRIVLRRLAARHDVPRRKRGAFARLADNSDMLELALVAAEDEGEELPVRQPRNWAGFLDALAAFFERIWPMIEKLIDRFFSVALAAEVPTTTSTATTSKHRRKRT